MISSPRASLGSSVAASGELDELVGFDSWDPRAPSLRLSCLARSPGLMQLHASARDASAPHDVFVRAAQRIIRLVLERALDVRRHVPCHVRTPIGATFEGAAPAAPRLTAITIPRAGDAMEQQLRDLLPGTVFGKILIQRDPTTKQPELLYCKLPSLVAGTDVMILDPMMATAGTAILAVETACRHGAAIDDIILATVLTCPSALERIGSRFPGLRVVTSYIDDRLTDQAFMEPGIGDFGDRFFGTTP